MKEIMDWLLEGDVSIRYWTNKWLLESDPSMIDALQNRIPCEGFAKELLSRRTPSGHWGIHYYQKKWTSTHYTLTDLLNLGVPNNVPSCCEMVDRLFRECPASTGGINLAKSEHDSDICVEGMALNYGAYFSPRNPEVIRVVKHLLEVQKKDGGFSWDATSEKGDPHTTICVLEGLHQVEASVPDHGISEIKDATDKAIEYLLANHLFIDDADRRFQKLSYPYRYRYDLLRVLEYFATHKVPYDNRMSDALVWLMKKRRSTGVWYLENIHKGNQHFLMEEEKRPSRFITLKALYIARYFKLQPDE